MKRETLFLRITVILIAIPILALCVYGLPAIAKGAAERFSMTLYLPFFIAAYASSIPFFIALYQTFKLLNYIDRNNAFSDLSVKALRTIKHCAVAISILYIGCIPFIFHIAEQEDAPGLGALGLVVIFASIVIAVFAAVLQKLLRSAIDIKSENDLTI